MVTPNQGLDWSKFQTPQSINENTDSAPQQSAPVPQEQNKEESDQAAAQKIMWGEMQTPSTYSGPVDPTADESSIGWLARNVVSHISRGFEQYAGGTGNLYKAGQAAVTKFPETFGLLGKGLSEFIGPEAWERMVKGELIPEASTSPPTSQQLKEGIQATTGDYTKPKTPTEKKTQEFTEDVGSTLLTRRPANARGILVNNLGIPAAANAVKQTVEGLGFGEDKATYAKLSVWTALALLGNVNGRQYATELVRDGRNGMPPYLSAVVPRYENNLTRQTRNFLQGDPRSSLAREQANAIQNDIANGQTGIRDLMNRYDAINAVKNNRGLFELNAGDRAAAVRNINTVRDVVRDEIRTVGSANPQALDQWNRGMQSLAVIHQSNRMSNWAQNVLTGPYAKLVASPIAALFGVTGYHHPLKTLAAAGIGASVYKSGQVAMRIWESQTLSRYYWGAISAAQAENTPAFLNNYQKLQKAYEKKYPSKNVSAGSPKKPVKNPNDNKERK